MTNVFNRPPWRNWLARSAVNRKVGGSSPPGGDSFCITEAHWSWYDSRLGWVRSRVQILDEPNVCNFVLAFYLTLGQTMGSSLIS
jgi:hypothetical protein